MPKKKKESEINRLFKKKWPSEAIRGDILLELEEQKSELSLQNGEQKCTTRRPTFPLENAQLSKKNNSKKSDRSTSSSTPLIVPLIPPQWEISGLTNTSEQLLKCIATEREKTLSNYGISPTERNRYTRHDSRIKERVEKLSLFFRKVKEQDFTKEVVRLMLVEPFTVRSIIDNFDYESVEKNNRDCERIRRIAKRLVETKVLNTRTIGPGSDGIEKNSFLRNTQLYWFSFHTKEQFETVLDYYRFKGKQFKRRVKRKKTAKGEQVKEITCEHCYEPITKEQEFRYYKEGRQHASCLRKQGLLHTRARE